MAARLRGELGRIAEALSAAATAGNVDPANPHIAAALRNLAEMRTVCFEAIGVRQLPRTGAELHGVMAQPNGRHVVEVDT